MVALFSVGIAPALALMSFFYLKDRFDSEPLPMVFRAFMYGALLVFPLMFIQYAFMAENIGQTPFVRSFLLTGLLEEFFKWFIFIYTVYKYTVFDSVYDGILYGASISLGFASVENVLYLLANGIEYAFSRAIFPVSSHALFGAIMGYYLGRAKFSKKLKPFYLIMALFIPFGLHGVYDFVLETVPGHWMYILVPFMIGLWATSLRKVKIANKQDAEIISFSEYQRHVE